MSAYCYLKI